MNRIIERMNDNYNEVNLKSLDKHIEEQANANKKEVTRMVIKHSGPTDVKLTEKSAKKCAEIVLKL